MNARPTTPYHMRVTVQQANVAQSAIRGFSLGLEGCLEPAPRMAMPVIAFSSDAIVWGNLGDVDTTDKFEIVIDIADLTGGRQKTLSPRELAVLLFNERVSERVNEALLWAMIWKKDVETNGSNQTNDQNINQLVGTVFQCFVESLARLLGPPKRA